MGKDRGYELLEASSKGLLIGAGIFAVLLIIVSLWRLLG